MEKCFTKWGEYDIIIPKEETFEVDMDYIERIKKIKNEKKITNEQLSADDDNKGGFQPPLHYFLGFHE